MSGAKLNVSIVQYQLPNQDQYLCVDVRFRIFPRVLPFNRYWTMCIFLHTIGKPKFLSIYCTSNNYFSLEILY